MAFSPRVKIIIALGLVAFGVAARLLPHAWDFTPITAIALFAAAYLGFSYSLIILFGAMALSDYLIGFYAWPVMASVYLSLALAALIGRYLKNKSLGAVAIGSLSSSLIFFIITNWAVWQFGALYSQSLPGLIDSYLMGLPFFRNSLLGDLLYTELFFGAYKLIEVRLRVAGRPAEKEAAFFKA